MTEDKRYPRFPIYSLFFLSGTCGLIYEIVWTRLLTLVLGSTTHSISTVLTAFMGGLALGSFIAGRLITGRRDELKVYGLLEGFIGIYCLAIPLIMRLFTPFYTSVYQSLGDSPYLFSLVRFAVSFSVLLVPTTLMGATLPVLTKYFARRKETLGGTVGKVYAVNTFGAVLGSFGAGFILLPALGTSRVILLAGLANIAICVVALLYARRSIPAGVTLEAAVGEEPGTGVPTDDIVMREELGTVARKSAVLTLLLWAFALSGFASMVYQVIWTRMLTLMIGSSTYAFSLIVTAFILGIGIGSIALSRYIDRKTDLLLLFAAAELVIGTSAVVVAYVFGKLPFFMIGVISRVKASFALTQFAEFLLVLALLLVPTTMMGLIFPLVSKIYTRSLDTVGKAVGNAYAANTLGAILGSFAGGFIFIPFLGMETGILIALSLNVLIGLLFWFLSPSGNRAARSAIAVVWLGAIVGFEVWSPQWNKDWITMGPYLYFMKYRSQFTLTSENIDTKWTKQSRLIYYKEDVSTTVSVRKDVRGHLTLQVNGKTDASTHGDMMTQELLAHVPLMLHPDPRNVLVIGLASGITVGSVEQHPIERVTAVEISPAMVEACALFRNYNGNAMEDPRFSLRIEDGRNSLLLSPQMYDVIISEPSNPWISGIGNLFTLEYFRLLHERLGPRGVACVWLQAYGIDPEDFRMIVRTFREVFPASSLWEPAIGLDYLLVGQKGSFALEYDALAKKFELEAVRADLARVGIESPMEFMKLMAMGHNDLAAYAGNGVIHTDDNSKLEFSCPKFLYTNTSSRQLEELSLHRANPLAYTTDAVPEAAREEFETVMRARALTLDAKRAESTGDMAGAENLFHTALMMHPGEEEARAALVRYYENFLPALVGQGNWEGVERMGKEILKLDRRSLVALDGLSVALIGRKSFGEALPVLDEAVQYFPDYAAFHVRLGYVYAQLGKTSEAIASYEEAVAKDPENPQPAFDLGVLYMNAGRPTDALTQFGRAVRIRPTFVEAYINLGGSLARLGRYEEARQAFAKVLEIDPKNEIAQRNLTRLGAREGLSQ